MTPEHYSASPGHSYWNAGDRTEALRSNRDDDRRRHHQFLDLVKDRRWMDIGTGAGGILDLMEPHARSVIAVEPQHEARRALVACGYEVYAKVEEVPGNDIEVATLFHVLEHLVHPIDVLSRIRDRMVAGGTIIVEVPHARDLLISFLDLEPFKEFTFWSEHLILHTRDSLKCFLEEAGFSKVVVHGFQRYPLSNHLYWLRHGAPGGHEHWTELMTQELEAAYADMLRSRDFTDTLISVARA